MEDLRKMNSNVAHDELLSVLNKIRKEQFPEIPERKLRPTIKTISLKRVKPLEKSSTVFLKKLRKILRRTRTCYVLQNW